LGQKFCDIEWPSAKNQEGVHLAGMCLHHGIGSDVKKLKCCPAWSELKGGHLHYCIIPTILAFTAFPMIRLALVSMLAMVPFGAGANQLFVSPKGSDRGQCDSPKKPCATIDRACSVATRSADRQTSIRVAGGVYQHNTSWGRVEARIGLRMMPTFPRPSLSFRTAGFPRYGWKAGM